MAGTADKLSSERNLLLGMLAAQLELLSFDEVRALWTDWQASPDQEFADRLVASGRINAEDRAHLEFLLERSLRKHGGNAEAGLATLCPAGEYQSLLATLNRSPAAPAPAGSTGQPPPNATGAGVLPFAETAVPGRTPAARPEVGTEVGRFARVRVHAAGGMGRVWLARDQRLERDVALKELRPEFRDNTTIGRRFLLEARITGRLDHPGIVPIYEMIDEGGRAAYAMRFLQGRTLSAAIKAAHADKGGDPLERAALLQAFVTVCNTVAYAHARGVLHRDLKGQNVLLGDFGEVIVLDWGLAKEMGKVEAPDEPGATVLTAPADDSMTQPGQIMGTPHYMSPEQASGAVERIDQRSDVYSLGAILYEILTGQAPFTDQTRAQADKSVEALIRRIREHVPTPPRKLYAGVPAALEAISLRALAKEPAERYAGATELAREVQRWLADEPVLAHPDRWIVRARRWARRHQTLVASLGMLVAALLVGLAVTAVLINQEQARTEEARARAEANFHKAQEAVDRYFTQVSEDRLLNEPSMAPLRKELLASARQFYEELARNQGQDPASRQALGEAQLKLAAITQAMGERTQALKILGEARALFQELADTHPDSDAYRLGLARSHLNLGYQAYLQDGRSPRAAADLEKAADLLTGLVKKERSRLFRSELANALNTLAAYRVGMFRVDDHASAAPAARRAEHAYLEAVGLWKQLADEEPDVPARLVDLAGGNNNLYTFYANLQEYAKSRDYLDKAMSLRKRLVDLDPANLAYQDNLAASYNNLGLTHDAVKESELAEQAFRRAIAIREKLSRENRQVVQFHWGLARSYFNLGYMFYARLLSAAGPERAPLLSKSKEAYDRSLDVYKRLHDDHPQELQLRVDYAVTLACMGDLMTEEKQALGVPWYDQAIPHLEEVLRKGDKTTRVRLALRNCSWGRAEALTLAGQFAQAAEDWGRAIDLDDGAHRKEWQARRAQARLELARQLAGGRQHQKAAAAVDSYLKDAPAPAQKAAAARVLARCIQAAEEEKHDKQVETYAVRVVALLREAHRDGYFKDSPGDDVLTVLQAVAPLARRADFQMLVKEIGSKTG